MVLLLIPSWLYAWDLKSVVTYFGTSDQTITIGWTSSNPVPNEAFDIELFHVERNAVMLTGHTSQLEISVQLPVSGHYIARVRCVAPVEESVCLGNDGNTYDNGICRTIWVESIDPTYAKVNDEPKGWWIYGHVAPPGPIE